MPSYEERVRDLNTKRARSFDAAKAILDRANAEGRATLSPEETAGYNRAEAEITKFERQRDDLIASDGAQREIENVNAELRRVTTPREYDDARGEERQVLGDFLAGRTSAFSVDIRRASYVSDVYRSGARGDEFRTGIFGDTGSSGGSLTIPSLVSSSIFEVMQSANVMRQTRMTVLTTSSGAPLTIPVASQGAASLIPTQDSTIGGTDPTMASKVLHAYDAGELVAISNDILQDSGVDVLAWVSHTIAVAVAKLEETWLVVGTGSGQPTGLMSAGATGSGGTVASGGSLILGPSGAIVEKLIDVQYSVNSQYRPVGEWLVNDTTAAAMRKLRVGAGGTVDAFAWSPSPTAGLLNGTPDSFLGRPIYASANVSAMGSDVKVLAYGDMSRFVMREVGGLRLERSTDVFFAKNQLAVRGVSRVDSTLVDATAVNYLHMNVT
jgi:HK97 family phage major capsid protein